MPPAVLLLALALPFSLLGHPAEAKKAGRRELEDQVLPEGRGPDRELPDPVLLPGRDHQVRELANGLRVSVLAAPDLPLVAVQHWVHAGQLDQDLPHQAHLVEHLVFSGTPAHPTGSYQALHDRYGGSYGAWTAPEYTLFESVIPAEALAELLSLSADRLGPRSFGVQAVEHERAIVAEEVRLREENSPFSRMSAAILAAERGQLGPEGEVPGHEAATSLDVEGCQRFYDTWYRPDRIHLVVVGPVVPEEVFELVLEQQGSWPARGASEPAAESAQERPGLPEKLVVSDHIPKVRIGALAFPLPSMRSTDYASASLMLRMLDGSGGDAFAAAYRKLGQPYFLAGSSSSLGRNGGQLKVMSVNHPFQSQRRVHALLDKAIERMGQDQWIDQDSLERARRELYRDALERTYSSSRLASALGRAHWLAGDENLALSLLSSLEDVTLGDVKSLWYAWVSKGTPSFIVMERSKP